MSEIVGYVSYPMLYDGALVKRQREHGSHGLLAARPCARLLLAPVDALALAHGDLGELVTQPPGSERTRPRPHASASHSRLRAIIAASSTALVDIIAQIIDARTYESYYQIIIKYLNFIIAY